MRNKDAAEQKKNTDAEGYTKGYGDDSNHDSLSDDVAAHFFYLSTARSFCFSMILSYGICSHDT